MHGVSKGTEGGLLRLEPGYKPQRMNSQPEEVLGHVKSSTQSGIYVLLDFHPYLESPVNIRLIKDIAISYEQQRKTLVFVSHDLSLPAELTAYSAEFELRLPDKRALLNVVKEVADKWAKDNAGRRVSIGPKAIERLVNNLTGLTTAEVRRLAHKAVYDDGAINEQDVPRVMRAKYEMLNKDGVLHYDAHSLRKLELPVKTVQVDSRP